LGQPSDTKPTLGGAALTASGFIGGIVPHASEVNL
jgi:hypothetical protein